MRVKKSLEQSALWDEVKNDLDKSPALVVVNNKDLYRRTLAVLFQNFING